jgi:hypothetical protein
MLAGAERQRRIRVSVDLRNSMPQLRDKVAVISGGTSGIGQQDARKGGCTS